MKRKFNFIEFMFFAVVLMVCTTSAIRLTGGVATENEVKAVSEPVNDTVNKKPVINSGRKIASINRNIDISMENEGYIPISLPCNGPLKTIHTNSSKIRLIGNYCGYPRLAPHERGVRADDVFRYSTFKILNSSSGYEALVLQNNSEQEFSTDFITLSQGDNNIDVVFNYSNSKQFKTSLKVVYTK